MSSSSEQLPLISLVTVVRNDATGLQKTIQSVHNQTYSNIEHIIIDGDSTDNTVEVIMDNQKSITRWISEPDSGLYDAMNKGIKTATGEWILFLNSGHSFYSNNTINDLFSSSKYDHYDVLYGDMVYETKFGNLAKYSNNIDKIWKGMSFSHQSTFFNTKALKSYRYNLDYRFASDFDMIYGIYDKGYAFHYIPNIISKRIIEGNTESNIVKSTIERYQIILKYRKDVKIHIFYIGTIIKYMVRKVIPNRLLNFYYYYRYKSNLVSENQECLKK